jgi:GT2 family glycosyltransferase
MRRNRIEGALRRSIASSRSLLGTRPTKQKSQYEQWLRAAARARRRRRRGKISRETSFSLLTVVYDGSPPELLEEAALSIGAQTVGDLEWIVFDNGTTNEDVRAGLLALGRDSRVTIVRSDEHLGIVNGLRRCLEHATREYVVPFDADDALVPDCLETLHETVEEHSAPAFLYSDEDTLADGRPQTPYLRPDWDPILNLCTSYVFHVIAFRRELALTLGVYSDERMNWCQDWDTVCRFAAAGHIPVHVRDVLYHWRLHSASSTNRPDPHSGSLKSQRHLLERELTRRDLAELFEIEPFPISRGAPELWLRRRRLRPSPLHLLVLSNGQRQHNFEALLTAAYPVAERGQTDRQSGIAGLADALDRLPEGWVAIVDDRLRPEGDEWAWEALGLRDLHPDLVLISGRVVDGDRTVVAGGEIFGFGGLVGSPDAGRHEHDAGYFGLALKQRSVSAVDPHFFLASIGFLRETLAAVREYATIDFLGAWLGAHAAARGARVGFSPLVTAAAPRGWRPLASGSRSEVSRFIASFGHLVPDRRWYHPALGLAPETAYVPVQLPNEEQAPRART